MRIGLLLRLFICILIFGSFLYFYINKQNHITELRLQIPAQAKELEHIQQEIVRLQFEVNRFESPDHLMELSRKPEFSHLKHPLMSEIIEVRP
ncbi:MAG: hypothetical protein ACKVOH_06195 [Chlamydiales bacterium]